MIQWLRSLLFFLGLNALGITLIPLMILASLFIPERHYRYLVKIWCQSALAWFRIAAGVRYKINGLENIAQLKDQPAIIVANHQSTFETFLLPIILPTHAYVLKRELLSIPIFGAGLKRLQPIAIDRSEGKKAFISMLKTSKERLAKGVCIVIFPEGTRVPLGKTVPYKSGAFVIASKLKAPILPICHNSGMAWARGKLMKNKGTIEITIGKLIDANNTNAQDLKDRTQEWIDTHKPTSLAP